jgi:hypothetical protein
VISDPLPARGQPAKQHRMEDTCHCKTQMQICPSKRVNLTLQAFVSANVEPGATVITDAWQSYRGLEKKGYIHDRRSQRAASAVEKTRARCCQACIESRPWQSAGCSEHTKERWTPRTCLATSTSSCSASTADVHVAAGCCFTGVLELAVAHDPVRYQDLTRKKGPKAMRPTPPRKRGHPPSLERPRQNRPWRRPDSG